MEGNILSMKNLLLRIKAARIFLTALILRSKPLNLVGMTGFEPATSCSQSRRATNCATSRNYSSGLWSVGGRDFGRYNIIAHFPLFFKRKFEIHKKRLKFHLIITAEGGFVKTLKQSFNYIYIATQKSTCFVSSTYGIIIMYI